MGGVDRHTPLTLDVFRESILAEAKAEAERLVAEADAAAGDRMAEARKRADDMVENAREEGRAMAERETALDRAAARRRVRGTVLDAQRRAFEELRERSIEALTRSDGLAHLMEHAEAMARARLGEHTDIEDDPGSAGFIATAGGRRLDFRASSLIDRAMIELGTRLEELWT